MIIMRAEIWWFFVQTCACPLHIKFNTAPGKPSAPQRASAGLDEESKAMIAALQEQIRKLQMENDLLQQNKDKGAAASAGGGGEAAAADVIS